MAKQQRPRRQRKGDRLLNPDARKDQIACDFALAPFDRLAIEMERKWGIDRLPELVSVETAARYGHAIADLNAAIESEKPEAVIATAQNCIKGMHVMDAEATAAGHKPISGQYWEYRLEDATGEDFHFALMQDNTEWPAIKDARPELRLFTIREAALALKAYSETFPIGEVKEYFPNAEITSIKAKLSKDFWGHGDEISF